MLMGARAPLSCEAGRLVQNQSMCVAVDDHLPDELCLIFAERHPLAHRTPGLVGNGIGRWHTDDLPCFDTIAGIRLLVVHPHLAGARPAGDEVEADVRHVALEPAVEADAVVVVGNGEGARVGHAGALSFSPANSRTRPCAACGSAFEPWGLPIARYRNCYSPPRSTSPDREGRRIGGRPARPVRARRSRPPHRPHSRGPCIIAASWAG